MKRKLATYFPLAVLAVGLTLGMAAALIALRPSANVPTVGAQTAPAATASPSTAGELVEYAITMSITGVMPAGTGEFRVTFDKDAQIPASIPASAILIQSSHLNGTAEIGTGPCPDADGLNSTDGANQVVSMTQSASFDTDTTDPNRKILILKVPDMNASTGTGSCGAGAQGIGGTVGTPATVVITFTTAAGIKNPSEQENSVFNLRACAAACTSGSTNLVFGTLLTDGTKATGSVAITPKITISSVDGGRGSKVTVVAKGFKDGTTATVWLDADNDNVRDTNESDLAIVVVGSDDTATATFTVTNPPFVPGNVNRIAVVDGRNQKGVLANNPLFDLRGTVEASPTTVRLGDTMTIQLKDFDANCNVASTSACTGFGAAPIVRLGGINLDKTKFSGTTTVSTAGEATFTAIVPNGVAIGTQALEVLNVCCGGSNSTRRQNLTVGGAVLILTPDTVVPNQTVSIIGNDFTTSDLVSGVTVNAASITGNCTVLGRVSIQGVDLATTKVNEGNTINVAAGGNWSASIIVPVTTTTTTPGTYDLKVIDCAGREGVAKLTLLPRTVALNPKEGQVGTPVNITGTGFPAKNDRTGGATNTTVTIKYDAGGANTTTISLQTDASGNINGTVNVPTNANIPSSNNVTTSFRTEGSSVDDVINTVVHEVPKASMIITPASGRPGTKVSAAVKGAKAFTTITSALIGANLDVKPAPTPFTDTVGNVTFEFVVPQMEVGVQNLEVKIGNTTASAAFTVEAAPGAGTPGAPPSAPVPVADALVTPLGADFVRAFNFNNQTKVWSFNDPRPEFKDINTLKDVNGGQVYWVNVANDKSITFCGRSTTLYKGWNQVPC